MVDPSSGDQELGGVSDRAAKAAARVAARFSSAPSYAEMQAAEARSALRDAEVATRAALEAQAVAQAALAELQRINEDRAEFEHDRGEESVHEAGYAEMSPQESSDSFYDREPAFYETDSSRELIAEAPEVSSRSGSSSMRAHEAMQPQTVEAQPIHANLIHFPRELVATRRIRPRLSSAAELSEEEQLGQLSIFEVDPNSIAIGPTASVAQEIAPTPSWSGPEWTNFDFELDRPRFEESDGEPPSIAARIHLAPFELRCMATLIDFALIIGMVCAGAAGMAGHLSHAPSIKVAELGGLAALLVTGLLYHVFFLLVALSTPGMMYAGIGLSTFEEEPPTRMQLRDRLGAMLISLLPVGVGMAWAIFDEDHLSWHDRISRTYLRRC